MTPQVIDTVVSVPGPGLYVFSGDQVCATGPGAGRLTTGTRNR